jgi:ketosteroid isomerase-like protein
VSEADNIAAALRFVDLINNKDLDRVAEMMPPDHRFQLADGLTLDGKASSVAAWQGFFARYPDLNLVIDEVAAADSQRVLLVGRTESAQPEMNTTAVWSVYVRAGQVAIWQVFPDSPEVRSTLRIR